MELVTLMVSKSKAEGGSIKLANHLMLPKRFTTDLYAWEPFPRKAINLKRTSDWIGKSGTLEYVVKIS